MKLAEYIQTLSRNLERKRSTNLYKNGRESADEADQQGKSVTVI